MKVIITNAKTYDKEFFQAANKFYNHELTFIEVRVSPETVACMQGYPAVCCFVNDQLNEFVLQQLAKEGTRLIATRSAGYNHIDLKAAKALNLTVVRVPEYSPHAIAEFALGLILDLNRKIYRAYAHVRDHDFSLKGLLGFDLYGRTVGVVGTGKIGSIFARMMLGIGCKVIAYDLYHNPECLAMGVQYTSFEDLCAQSDIISLHCPLMPETHHLINQKSLAQMKDGVMIINTSRGAILDTPAVVEGLKSGKIGYLGLDVYEEEEKLFFEDLSSAIIKDDVFTRLQTFPNVIITGHQAFFTEEALRSIARTTLSNITAFEKQTGEMNQVKL